MMAASGLLEIQAAQRLILNAASPLVGEAIELDQALGRVLGNAATAAAPVPAFDSSAMDGFAVRARDTAQATTERPALLRIVGESRAGLPARVALSAGQAISISTGAMVPEGADSIVRLEDTRRAGEEIEVLLAAAQDQDIRRAGEDIRAGQTVLRAGSRLGPAELGVLASLGYGTVLCARQPRVSVLVSGDELIASAQPARPGMVRDSNSLTIRALAHRAGALVPRSAVVADDAAATRIAIAQAVEDVDIAVICGGVSVGAHDHIRSSLQALGVRQGFWGLALKPGRPAWFGRLGSTLVFGLPGNPVSAMVTFVLLVAPALRAMLGIPCEAERSTAVIDSDYDKPAGRTHAVRCRLSLQEDGWHATPTGGQGSHILSSMLDADALALIPSDTLRVRAGERVPIELLRTRVGALL